MKTTGLTLAEAVEEWRDVPGYEGIYRVSNKGNLWSLIYDRQLKNTPHSNGYIYWNLTKGRKKKTIHAHRVVALSFIGNPGGYHVNHINAVKTDNRLSNLEIVTPKQNMEHASANFLMSHGEGHRDAALDETMVCEIVTLYLMGYGLKVLARFYCVHHSSISKVIKGQSWKHLGFGNIQAERAAIAAAEKE